jgi:hypothetical protein
MGTQKIFHRTIQAIISLLYGLKKAQTAILFPVEPMASPLSSRR